MFQLTVTQNIYIIFLALGGALFLLLLGMLIYFNFIANKKVKELTYLKLKRLCDFNDFLLLNNYHSTLDESHEGIVDHIVICKKFIILINDFSLSGVISGSYQDETLKNYNKNKGSIIANPLNYNINLAKRLSLFNDLDPSFLKGLVVINNDSEINVANMSNQFLICKRKDIKKIIKQFDKEDVKNLNENSVVRFINYLNSINHG